MKQQVVILKVKFDDEHFEPRSWNWSEVIGCDVDCVEVMNYGRVEDLEESSDPKEGSE
jgi:hypothetical protein